MSKKSKEIIEKVQDCKFVFEEHEENGCDCWGKIDWYTRQFVYIDGKKEQCFDDWYVIHDGTNVLEVVSEDGLEWRKERKEQEKRTKAHLKKTGFETPREYAAYKKGLKEWEKHLYLYENDEEYKKAYNNAVDRLLKNKDNE